MMNLSYLKKKKKFYTQYPLVKGTRIDFGHTGAADPAKSLRSL